MKFRTLLFATTLLPLSVFAQKKEVVELGRDVSLLQDQMRTLQRSQDEKFAALTILIQQALEAANKANTAVAVLQSGLNDRLGEQSKSVGGTVAGIGTKVDQMSDQFGGVRESVADLNARMGKLDAKLTDISNAIRTLSMNGGQSQAPPPQDGIPSATVPPGSSGQSQPQGTPPSAEATYENANRDLSGGKIDLALQEFQEYLKWFRNTDLAPNAQFHIGEIYLRQGDNDNAIKAFDAVLETFSENNKTADAHFFKARALFQAGQKTAASKEYCEVVKRYPKNPLAPKAKSALLGMGYSGTCGVASSAAPAAKSRKRR